MRRVFIAFLISNFAFPVQVWLGIEYRKLAAEMDEIGRRDSRAGFSTASRFFKVASTLCLILFAMGVTGMTASYISLYREMFELVQDMMSPASSPFPGLFGFVYCLFPLVVVQAGLGIASCLVLRKGWNAVQGAFTASTLPAVSGESSGKVDRVIKGLKWGLVADCLSVPFGVLLLPIFSMMERLVSGVMAPTALVLYIILLVAILLLALAIASGILRLLGTINQGIGLFDLSKILQDRSKMEAGSLLAVDRAASYIPGAREAPVACPTCGNLLPRAPNLHYCPTCGAMVRF
ncbi:MAG: hypothetical protein Q6370_003365 [Candidatus Sigynarchaeota archaeon]